MTRYNREYLESVITGGCLLASGGGGTYTSAKKLLTSFHPEGGYYKSDTADIISVDEVKKREGQTGNGYACVVAYIGAPEKISDEKYPLAVERAVLMMKARLEKENKHLKYLVPVECGALGLVVPALLSARLGLPAVNGDGAGRAVPELTMLTFAGKGVSTIPTCLTNDQGVSIELDVKAPDGEIGGRAHQESSAATIERLVRPILGESSFQQVGGIALWAMDAETLERALPIQKTYDHAHALGEFILGREKETPSTHNLLKELVKLDYTPFELFRGRIVANKSATSTSGGFDHGQIVLKKENSEETATVLFVNESLIAWNSTWDHPMAMAPDAIAYYVEDDEQKVYSNGDLLDKIGRDPDFVKKPTSLIGIKADGNLRDNERALLTESWFIQRLKQGEIMRSFKKILCDLGYLGEYLKIEDIWSKRGAQ